MQENLDQKRQKQATQVHSQAAKRSLIAATERGSSSWLFVLPLEDEGKSLSKQEI